MELKKLVFNMWKTGLYQSKLDLISFLQNNYNAFKKQEIIDNVEDVLSNIDKYEVEFKQTKTEQFFIELLQLMKKYNVQMYADFVYNHADMRIFFETKDGLFVQSCSDYLDSDYANEFNEFKKDKNKIIEGNISYNFPAVDYFEQEGIKVKNEI